MPKYPRELVLKAREHYNISEAVAGRFSLPLLAICVSQSNAMITGRKKPVGLEMYTTLEIAEIIKDLDRHG